MAEKNENNKDSQTGQVTQKNIKKKISYSIGPRIMRVQRDLEIVSRFKKFDNFPN
jgi:hypothetical protein